MCLAGSLIMMCGHMIQAQSETSFPKSKADRPKGHCFFPMPPTKSGSAGNDLADDNVRSSKLNAPTRSTPARRTARNRAHLVLSVTLCACAFACSTQDEDSQQPRGQALSRSGASHDNQHGGTDADVGDEEGVTVSEYNKWLMLEQNWESAEDTRQNYMEGSQLRKTRDERHRERGMERQAASIEQMKQAKTKVEEHREQNLESGKVCVWPYAAPAAPGRQLGLSALLLPSTIDTWFVLFTLHSNARRLCATRCTAGKMHCSRSSTSGWSMASA
jgi:hypothetical protein